MEQFIQQKNDSLFIHLFEKNSIKQRFSIFPKNHILEVNLNSKMGMVRGGGLEPPHREIPEPKSGASAISPPALKIKSSIRLELIPYLDKFETARKNR